MEKKQKGNLLLNSTGSLILLVISILLGSIVSFSWLSVNNKVDSKNMTMDIDTSDVKCSFALFAYDLSKLKATDYREVTNSSGISENISNKLNDYSFNTHDAIFEELNYYTTAVVEIVILGKYINEHTSGTIISTIEKQGSATNKTKLDLTVSNILSFCTGFSSDIKEQTTINDKWESAKDLFEEELKTQSKIANGELATSSGCFKNIQTFISESKQGSTTTYSTVSTIELETTYSSNDRYKYDENNYAVCMYLVIDYSPKYTEAILEQEGIEITTTASFDLIPIENDLQKITISSDEGHL